jgi:signal transduction histidine kinase
MTESRWWTLAVLVAVSILSALVLWEQPATWRLAGAIASMVLFAVVWLALGKRALADNQHVGVIVAVLVILITSAAVYFEADMATLQCVACPIIWTVSGRLRPSIIAGALLGISVGIAMFLGLGATPAAAAVAGAIQGLSLVFSLALGLWISSIARGSDERKRLIEQLEAAQSELSAFSRDAGATSERERLARELHDTIAQDLTGLVMTAQRGLRELKAGNTAAVEKQLGLLEENARHALVETRTLVASGAAAGVDGGGLAIALRRLAERFERETGIAVSVAADDAAALDRDGEVVLLRCAQEALANVRKHSTAKTAALTLSVRDNRVDLRITDDGNGFDTAAPTTGFGLPGLRERLSLVRGTLAITASPGGGTTLVASLPGTDGTRA